MKIQTLADVRGEIAKRRVSQRALAEVMNRSEASISHLMSWEDEVMLSPRGVAVFSEAIEEASRERMAR